MFSKIHEECGVFGIYSSGGTDVAGLTYSALFALQHRGQESCGIAVNDDGVISGYKDLGLVGEVFPPERLQKLGYEPIGSSSTELAAAQRADLARWEKPIKATGVSLD